MRHAGIPTYRHDGKLAPGNQVAQKGHADTQLLGGGGAGQQEGHGSAVRQLDQHVGVAGLAQWAPAG